MHLEWKRTGLIHAMRGRIRWAC